MYKLISAVMELHIAPFEFGEVEFAMPRTNYSVGSRPRLQEKALPQIQFLYSVHFIWNTLLSRFIEYLRLRGL